MIESPALLSRLVQIIQPLPLAPPARSAGAPGRPDPGRAAGIESTDRVEISPEARWAAGLQGGREEWNGGSQGAEKILSSRDLQVLQEMKRRDREVRAHENAHKAAGGQYAGAVSLQYRAGPDGKFYAVGGEVPIDLSPVDGDPRATAVKMQKVQQAALAPADPSPRDRQIAALAARKLREAQRELSRMQLQDGAEVDFTGEGAASGRYRARPDSRAGSSMDVSIDTYA